MFNKKDYFVFKIKKSLIYLLLVLLLLFLLLIFVFFPAYLPINSKIFFYDENNDLIKNQPLEMTFIPFCYSSPCGGNDRVFKKWSDENGAVLINTFLVDDFDKGKGYGSWSFVVNGKEVRNSVLDGNNVYIKSYKSEKNYSEWGE